MDELPILCKSGEVLSKLYIIRIKAALNYKKPALKSCKMGWPIKNISR